MMRANYNSTEDFVADESFQDFCLGRDERSTNYWEKYISENPDKKALIDESLLFVTMLSLDPPIPIEQNSISSNDRNQSKSGDLYKTIGVTIISVLLFVFIYYLFFPKPIDNRIPIAQHSNTENLHITLSDSTLVDLRKGSTLTYMSNWASSENREVWLKGQAYFDVAKSKNLKFTVHLDQGIISVLGTKFLVKSTDQELTILLEEGSVEYAIDNEKYTLSPGDKLNYNSESISIHRNNDPRTFDSWRLDKLTYKNTSLDQVITQINNSYDMEVILENPELGKRKITATVANTEPLLILEAIAAIYDIGITKEDNKIILK